MRPFGKSHRTPRSTAGISLSRKRVIHIHPANRPGPSGLSEGSGHLHGPRARSSRAELFPGHKSLGPPMALPGRAAPYAR